MEKDAVELLLHLDVWSTLWNREFDQCQSKVFDAFYFDNSVTFPKESAVRLLRYGASSEDIED